MRTLLDAGCGDFHWMRAMPLDGVRYIGIDVVDELIAADRRRYGSADREFLVRDLTRGPLPRADLVLCRHVLFHLPNRLVLAALRTVCASGAGWLLATTDPDVRENVDVVTGSFRPLNLQLPPFDLPSPRRRIEVELPVHTALGDPELPGRDCLGLWPVDELVRSWIHAG